jgi:nardilysin
MSAGNGETGSEHNSMYALFTVSLTLTTEGLSHLYEVCLFSCGITDLIFSFQVIQIVFSYINMLKKLGPQERLYNEMKTIADTAFKFAIEERAVELVEELSEAMQFYPPEDYMTGSELYFEYDPDAIKMVLDSFIPRKMNVIVFCNNLPPGLNYDKTEKWFSTKYTEQG